MTVSGTYLGFAIGALSPTYQTALVSAISILIVMMVVGIIIYPSGVDQSQSQPIVVRALQQLSPIAFAIKALCVAEYRGMEIGDSKKENIFSMLVSSRHILKDLPRIGALASVQNGDQILKELGLEKDTYKGAMEHIAILSISNLILSWIGLVGFA